MVTEAGEVYREAALIFNMPLVLSLKDCATHWGPFSDQGCPPNMNDMHSSCPQVSLLVPQKNASILLI